jgi:hypothetical protein
VWTQLKVNGYFNLQASGQHHPCEARQHLEKDVIARNENNLKIMNENEVMLWDNYWTKFRKV